VNALSGCFLLLLSLPAAAADDFGSLCEDRTAIEKVYHAHRLGNTQSFEQRFPRPAIERLVRLELKKEATLKQRYGVEISPAQVEGELKRVDATTRAPDVLRELKKALGNDPVRFARAVARPLVVERELRARFDNDDRIHAPQRQEAEDIRLKILAAKKDEAGIEGLLELLKQSASGSLHETTWRLGPREPGLNDAVPFAPIPRSEAKAQGGIYSVEATAQLSKAHSAPENPPAEPQHYFADLPQELQNVLSIQLQKPGDVSAVIETPKDFVLFLAEEKTPLRLSAAAVAIPKRNYEMWLAEQGE